MTSSEGQLTVVCRLLVVLKLLTTAADATSPRYINRDDELSLLQQLHADRDAGSWPPSDANDWEQPAGYGGGSGTATKRDSGRGRWAKNNLQIWGKRSDSEDAGSRPESWWSPAGSAAVLRAKKHWEKNNFQMWGKRGAAFPVLGDALEDGGEAWRRRAQLGDWLNPDDDNDAVLVQDLRVRGGRVKRGAADSSKRSVGTNRYRMRVWG